MTKKEINTITKESKKIDKCWNCGKYPISTKDYREDDCGNINKTYVCKYCCNLNDVWYYRVRVEKLNPKKILEG